MDLIAFITVDQRVEVFRFGGQRAYSLVRKDSRDGGVKVVSLCWKYNGQYLAVSWSDGRVDVLSSETGAPLQIFRQVASFQDNKNSEETNEVFCVGWGMNLVDKTIIKSKPSAFNGAMQLLQENEPPESTVNFDDLLDRDPDIETIGVTTELSDQLAQFDALELMPKLPTITMPTSNTSRIVQGDLAEVFASQSLLDAALRKSSSQELHALNTFLVSNENGIVRMIVYDSLNIGNISPPFPPTCQVRYIGHTFHPFAHCHVLLAECKIVNTVSTALLPLSFRFLKQSGKNIHLIASKTAQLEVLFQYVGEAILAIDQHWKVSRDLPSRFQSIISETLAEKDEPEFAQSMYQLAATGYCSPTFKEWLVQELGDHGYKRWEQSIAQGYTKVLQVLQENLLPSLDRCMAILSNLQGLAQYYENSTAFNIPATVFTPIFQVIKCIQMLAHHMLVIGAQEHYWFLAFTKWFHHSINVQATDPNSAAAEEIMEKDPGIDYLSVMNYIREAMVGSKLDLFLSTGGSEIDLEARPEIYSDLKGVLVQLREKGIRDKERLRMSSYFKAGRTLGKDLVDRFTGWQREMSIIPGNIMLSGSQPEKVDIRMISESGSDQFITYVLLKSAGEDDHLTLFKISHSELFDDLSESEISFEGTRISIPSIKILDLKFIDDFELAILIESSPESSILILPYTDLRNSQGQRARFEKLPVSRGSPPQIQVNYTIDDFGGINQFVVETFNHEDGFIPLSMEINGRKNRRTCVIAGSDKKQTRVYDLTTRYVP